MSWIDRIDEALNAKSDILTEDERDFPTLEGAHRPAAVLIPITDRPDPGVILTQRPLWLRNHAGQIAFPGGKIDATDEDAVAAALREADEELGIPPSQVRLIGIADTYFSASGYEIVPVIGLIPPDLNFVANPDEVESWFEVPLSFLVDPANIEKNEMDWNGHRREYYDIYWQDRRIWGVTAGIIANLARRLA